MKVSGPGGVSQTSGPKPARAGGGGAFQVATPQATSAPVQVSTASGVSGMMGLEALIALQDVGSPLERRRRSVSRAGRILDVLEGVKVAMLGGDLSEADLERLRRAVREERSATEDPKLEAVLDEIETRAEVELAKLETAAHAA